jgi:uncharacterized membrane protein YbhN (UPF0104 family)
MDEPKTDVVAAPKKSRRWLRPAITWAFYVILIVAIAYALTKVNWSSLSQLSFNVGYLAVALVLALGFRYWQTFIWITVLRNLGAKDVRMSPELIEVYSKSWLGRYIPGTAPWILGKIYFASQHGLSKSKLAVGSLLEAAIQIVVLLTTSAIFLLSDPRLDVIDGWVKVVMVVVIVGGVIVLIPPVFNRVIDVALRLVRRAPLAREDRANTKTILVASAQYAVGAVLTGGSLFFVAKAAYPQLDFKYFLFIVAASNLAGAVSMVVIIAPSGIGVRDGIQAALFATIMPAAVSVAIALFTRLWNIAIDVLFFLIGRVILIVARRRRARP